MATARSLSLDYTAARFWREGFREITFDINDGLYIERFALMNRRIAKTFNAFQSVLGGAYIDTLPYPYDFTVKYAGTRGNGTYVAATKILTDSLVSTAFQTYDIDKPIIFRTLTPARGYMAFIDEIISPTAIRVRSDLLPLVNIAIEDFIVVSAPTGSSSMSLLNVRMNRMSQVRLWIESSATDRVDALERDLFRRFDVTSPPNLKRIVYTVESQQILLKRGDDLADLGTCTLHYPRVPLLLDSDDDYVDLPDGYVLQAALTGLSIDVATRHKRADLVQIYTAQLQASIGEVMKSFQMEVTEQTVKEKLAAIL